MAHGDSVSARLAGVSVQLSRTGVVRVALAYLTFCCMTTAAGIFFDGMGPAGEVMAHTNATGVVKERMDGMKDMSRKTKAVGDMLKGKTDYDKSLIVQAADSYVMHSAVMLDLFPDSKESRTGSETDALPAIWKDWDEFEKLASGFYQDSVWLKETLQISDDPKTLKRAFIKTARNCRQCHKEFRRRKH